MFTTPDNFTVLKAEGDFLDIEPECVDTPEFLGGVKSKMCILPGERFSENGLKSSGVFDGDMVNRVLKALTVYKDATFIGIIDKILFGNMVMYRLWSKYWNGYNSCCCNG